jgi:hypothetical protein
MTLLVGDFEDTGTRTGSLTRNHLKPMKITFTNNLLHWARQSEGKPIIIDDFEDELSVEWLVSTQDRTTGRY